jgi:hypothetical protein
MTVVGRGPDTTTRIGQPGQVSLNRLALVGELGKGGLDWSDWTGQKGRPGHEIKDRITGTEGLGTKAETVLLVRTAGIGQSGGQQEQGSQDRTAGIGQLGTGHSENPSRDSTVRTGKKGKDSLKKTARTE